jgi:hypothetical protein
MVIVTLKVELELHHRKNSDGSYAAWYEPLVEIVSTKRVK